MKEDISCLQKLKLNGIEIISFFFILDTYPGPIYITNIQTHDVLYVNKYIEKLFYPEKCIGQKCYKVFQNKESPCEFCTNELLLRSGGPIIWNFYNKKLKKWYKCVDNILRVNKEEKRYRIEIAIDITGFHMLEKELLQAQKMENLGLIAGGIAHDFNNILQGITGYLSLIEVNLANPNPNIIRQYIGLIEQLCLQGREIIGKIMEFSRPVPKNRKEDEVEIEKIIKNVVEICRNTFPKKIKIKMESEDYLHKINADEGVLAQVFMNLLINARDAIEKEGTIKVNVFEINYPENINGEKILSPKRETTKMLCCKITDNGCGIPPEKLHTIFDPFYTTKDKGTGLGLSMVYRIMENYNGGIYVESIPQQGTSFYLLFPIY